MSLLDFARTHISPQNPLLLVYHKMRAVVAAIWYGFPGTKLKVIAITGTKGKSTVTRFIASILREAGHKVGYSSTIDFQIGDTIFTNDLKQTTPSPFLLQKLLAQMVAEHCDFAVIETTSHALIQSRLWGINVDTAVLTNIARDHLEYHGGFEEYLHAKGLLFQMLGSSERKKEMQKTSILPAEDEHLPYFESFSADRKMTYGLQKGMIRASSIQLAADCSRFTLEVPNGQIAITIKLPGEFTIRNALAAASACLASGVKLSAIKEGLENIAQIPGRLETIELGQPFTVVVDYAHTVESLEALLSLFKGLTRGRLFIVFGATGGGRDKEKRPKMGAVAGKYADYVIVTDDDPYTEDRMEIIDQVAAGLVDAAGAPRREGEGFWKIRDRREAIRLAVTLAGEGDTVIVAGKGCEPIQIIGKERIVWDDRAVVRELLGSELRVAL